jgi:ketosteroid isomerase-like protein
LLNYAKYGAYFDSGGKDLYLRVSAGSSILLPNDLHRRHVLRVYRMIAVPAILLTFFAGVAPIPKLSAASDEHQNDRAAITKILEAQQNNWNQGNVDAFLEGYWHSPDLTFSGSGGIARGWDGVLARYKKNYPNRAAMGQLDFSGLEFRFLGNDAALVLGHWHLARAQGDVGGVFSLVWQRFPEGWRIIHDHTSSVEKAK